MSQSVSNNPAKNSGKAGPKHTGVLVDENYRGYKLLQYGCVCAACPVADGAPDFDAYRTGKNPQIIADDNAQEVRRRIDAMLDDNTASLRLHRGLLVCEGEPSRIQSILSDLPFGEVTLLLPEKLKGAFPGYSTIDTGMGMDKIASFCMAEKFDGLVAPFSTRLSNNPWERLAVKIVPALYAVFADGTGRLYQRDHFSRIQYNMAYLRSMFRYIPKPMEGLRVLEIGCSDGQTCDIVAKEHPTQVDGLDLLETTGILYPNERVKYHLMDAAHLEFDSDTFDLVYSIATFEHIPEPIEVMREIRRVLKPSGHAYIQAAPLYYAAFGHHMFGYFDDYPWIHVRMSKEEIIKYCYERGIDEKMKARGTTPEAYIHAMINPLHINGRRVDEYHIPSFIEEGGIHPIAFVINRMGEALLSAKIVEESGQPEDVLTAQGFEFVFSKR